MKLFLLPYSSTREKSPAHGFLTRKNTLSSTGENSYSTGSFCEKLNLFNIGTKFQIAHTQGSFEEVKVLTHHSTGPTHIRKFEKTKSPHTTTQRYCENLKVFTNHNGAHTHRGTMKISTSSHITTKGNFENFKAHTLKHRTHTQGEFEKNKVPTHRNTGELWKSQCPHISQHRAHTQGIIIPIGIFCEKQTISPVQGP